LLWQVPGVQGLTARFGAEILVGTALFAALLSGQRWARVLTLIALGLAAVNSIENALFGISGSGTLAGLVGGVLYGGAFLVLQSKGVKAYLETRKKPTTTAPARSVQPMARRYSDPK
jgi:hypothetical protein